jgi:hypothetical protein
MTKLNQVRPNDGLVGMSFMVHCCIVTILDELSRVIDEENYSRQCDVSYVKTTVYEALSIIEDETGSKFATSIRPSKYLDAQITAMWLFHSENSEILEFARKATRAAA